MILGILFIALALVWLGLCVWALWKCANAMWRDVREVRTGTPADPRGFEVIKRDGDQT